MTKINVGDKFVLRTEEEIWNSENLNEAEKENSIDNLRYIKERHTGEEWIIIKIHNCPKYYTLTNEDNETLNIEDLELYMCKKDGYDNLIIGDKNKLR